MQSKRCIIILYIGKVKYDTIRHLESDIRNLETRKPHPHSQWIDDLIGALELVDVVLARVIEYGVEVGHLVHFACIETKRACWR